MPILATDLIQFAAVNMPEDDTGTSGGAIDLTRRPDLIAWTAADVAAVISDGTDVRTGTVFGRLASGVRDSEAFTLNNAVEVVLTKSWAWVEKIVLNTTSATRTVTLRQGTGGATRATIRVNETAALSILVDAASAAGVVIRYSKTFWKNTHATLSLLAAQLTLTADPGARFRIGGAPSADDTATQTNRVTAPASVTFVDDGVAQNVPGTDLAAGTAIGLYIEENLPASDPATRTSVTTQLSGSTAA